MKHSCQPLSTDTTDTKKAMFEEFCKCKDNRLCEHVNYNNQKLILLCVYSSKVMYDNKKIKTWLAAKGYQEESNIKSNSLTCTRESLHVIVDIIPPMQ